MTLQIYDGMAVCRRKLDFDPFGKGARSLFNEMFALQPGTIAIWCWEGKGSLASRRAVFPGYKVRPSTMTDGLMAVITLIREALEHTPALQVAVPGREADDVIAHLCQVYGPKQDVFVHTIDRDLKALEGGRVKILCDPLKSIEPGEVRLYKTLVGDQSDKISGMPGFGIKSFLECDREILAAAMKHLIEGRPYPDVFVKAGVKPAMADRICEPQQAKLLQAYWEIIGFFPMPDGWEKNIITGRADADAGDAVLREFHH